MVRTPGFRTVKIRVEPFGAHLGDLFDLAIGDVLEEPPEVGPRVESLQLLLVQVQLLVHPPFVLELQTTNN